MYAQNIKGKWLAINNFGVYSDPSIYILEILDNKIAHYDFDELLFEENYKLSGSNINIKNIRRYNFESLDLNLIKMNFYDEDGLTLVFSLKFIKIDIYKIELQKTEELVNHKFKIYDENFSNFIAFNKLLINSDLFNLGNYQVGNYIKLEKFSNTYFIVIYFDQYKQKVIPIKSFDGENLTLYGLDYINPYLEFIAKKF